MINPKKVDRDPFYSDLLEYGPEFLKKAGYFNDSVDEIDYATRFKLTPFNHLSKYDDEKTNVVLLSTGSYNPVHKGHLEMMEVAKHTLTEKGYNVLGGYLSPSHQKYIDSKKGDDAIGAEKRNLLVSKLCETDYPNYATLTWESLHLPGDVNFTEVIKQLELQFERYYEKGPVKVCYVFGSDNAGFALTFIKKGMCICVRRNTYENKVREIQSMVLELGLDVNTSVNQLIFSSNTTIPNYSSTKILEEEDFSVFSFPEVLILKTNTMYAPFNRHFYKFFPEIRENYLKKSKIPKNEICLSLDKHTEALYNLRVSRNFDTLGYRQYGYHTIPNNTITNLTPKTIYLFDDDKSTGGTINYITEELKTIGVEVSHVVLGDEKITKDILVNYEIADITDFMISEGDGLMVNCERLPYLFPFVSPSARVSIEDEKEFSILMWEQNKKIFSNHLVEDVSFSKTLNQMGYDNKVSMSIIISDIVEYINYCKG